MTNILFVTSSPRGEASHSTKVAQNVVDDLLAHDPSAIVTRRDLSRDPLPHLDESFLGAMFTKPDERSPEQAARLVVSDHLVDELLAADIVVIASAMINFTITSSLKTWLDHVTRAGRTFKYMDGRPVGLVTGKRVILVEAKGGIYSAGPMQPHDYQLPYLRFVLGFLGMSQVEVISVEGMVLGPDIATPAIAKAHSQASEVARSITAERMAA